MNNKEYCLSVCLIPDYCSEKWGFKRFQDIDAVQNKSTRMAAIKGDVDYTDIQIRCHPCMTRFWNRFIDMHPISPP